MRIALICLMISSLCGMNFNAASQPTTRDEQRFVRAYRAQLESVSAVDPDMVVEGLRLRVEEVASRGSKAAGASHERQVRGFESALLQTLQRQLCPAGLPASSTPPTPPREVVSAVHHAAEAQHLRTRGDDVAELTALTEGLMRSQSPGRFCGIRSLDDIR